MNRKGWKNIAWIVLTLAVVATVFAPTGTAADRRLVVSVDEPFEIGGELYPPGTLTVKGVRAFNPSLVMGEIWVGTECLGMYQATRVASATDAQGPSLTFRRTSEGRLALVGFSSTLHDLSGRYRFQLQANAASKSETTLAQR